MKDEPDDVLISRIKALHWVIVVEDVGSAHDIMEYQTLSSELIERGYRLVESLDVVKDEPDAEEVAA